MPTSPLRPSRVLILGSLVAILSLGCAATIKRVEFPDAAINISALWVRPADLERRNLYEGPGEIRLTGADGPFTVLSKDTRGASPGYDVRDARGREWSVKLGVEVQPEVTTSRILWAMGFHQDTLYYMREWRMAGHATPQPEARFRAMSPDEKVVAEWSWRQNPFIGTQPFGGLLVANLILNNWDWKTNNNKVYAVSETGGRTSHRYVVRDLGASLGRTIYPQLLQPLRLRGFVQGTKNDIDGFERQGFITSIDEDHVEFDYRGIHRDLIGRVKPADVRWACDLLSQLSDAQWRDAFRAGGYEADIAARYIRKIRAKVAEGLSRTGQRAQQPPG